ncbi:MAG TPA: heparinase II/III family protein [Chloroflexota bacterium]|nr:heparinase II/III family protein [Chloroflexota bacterium]
MTPTTSAYPRQTAPSHPARLPALLSRLPLYIGTARHFHRGQIAARLKLYAARRTVHCWPWFIAWRYGVAEASAAPCARPLLPHDRALLRQALEETGRREAVEARFADLQAHRFSFLNRALTFGPRIDWASAGESRLWRYNLHYFDCCWDLIFANALRDDRDPYRCFRHLVEDWIAQNPPARGVGWHAYPLSLRVVNWIYAATAFAPDLDEDPAFRRHFLVSLCVQCRFLADHVEWDSRGNHLLENGKTLVIAGLFFGGEEAERWLRRGTRIVDQALHEQILPDGGHYERSPMYHAVVVQDYLELAALYAARGLPLPAQSRHKLQAAIDFFIQLRHPDGRIPLCGDAAFGVARELDDVLPAAAALLGEPRYRRPEHPFSPYAAVLLGREGACRHAALPPMPSRPAAALIAFPDSGYFILGNGQGDALVFDVGEIGPDEVPAHGHCNTFGYELSCCGQRVIVDSGIETYEPGEWRAYYRSTRAHNTLAVDGLEQSEVWAAFRVARRARVHGVRWGTQGQLVWVEGTHDGFVRALPGMTHRRFVAYVPGAFWLIADCTGDWAGVEEHYIESLVHLHPDVTPGHASAATDAIIPLHASDGRVVLNLMPFGFGGVRTVRACSSPPQGWYAPEFGCRLPNDVLVLKQHTRLPHLCGYVLARPEVGLLTIEAVQGATCDVYKLSTPRQKYRITRTPGGVTVVM